MKSIKLTLVSLCFILFFNSNFLAQFDCLNFEWELSSETCGLANVEIQGNLGDSDLTVQIFGPGTNETIEIGQNQDFSYLFQNSGLYILTVDGILGCSEFSTFTFPIEIPDCDGCQQEVSWNTDCLNLFLEVGSTEEIEWVLWDFGNGVLSEEGQSVQYQYEEPGIYPVCVTYYVPECEQEYSECFQIEVSCEELCNLDITGFQEECGHFYFAATGQLVNDELYWYLGDGTQYYSGLTTEHYFSEPGIYDVCVEAYSPECSESLFNCFTIEVTDCGGCEQELYWDEFQCGVVEFEVGSSQTVGDASWDFGDGTYGEEHYTQHSYEEPGTYQVCVEYWSMECNETMSECFEINVEGCDPVCEPQMLVSEIECNIFVFELVGLPSNAEVFWQFGDGEFTEGFFVVTHEFEEDGNYSVCPFIWTQECEEVGDCCVEVDVDCGQECPEVFINSLECLEGSFGYEGNVSGSSVCWEIWQDGVMLSTYFDGNYTDVTFPDSGIYQVGVTNALNCDGNETDGIFITVEVTGCNYDCYCDGVSNLIVNGDFETEGFSNSEFPFDCSCQYSSVCVGSEPKDKCINALWLNDLWDHTLGTEDGNFLIIDGDQGVVWYDQVEVEAGMSYNFSFWTVREISDNSSNYSYQNLDVTVNGNAIYSFTTEGAPGQEWVQYCVEYYASETGTIDIAIEQIAGYGFDDWGLDDVAFGVCGEQEDECPEIVTYETDECGTFEFDYYGDISGSLYCWEFWGDGFFSTYFDGETTSFNFSESGTYYATVTNAILCPEQELIVEIIVPECANGCINAVGGIQTGCTTSVLTVYADFEIEEIHWLINGEVIIAGNNFEYDFESSEDQFIEIAFIPGINCNDLLQGWEIPIFMDPTWCQDGCEIGLEYEQLENSNFLFSAYPSFEVTEIIWHIDGEIVDETGLQMDNVFSEPGTYTVCAQFFSEDCPYGTSTCAEVIVHPEDCPEITYSETENCGIYEFTFSGFIDGPLYCWDAWGNGLNTSFFDGQTTTIEFPGPGVYSVAVTNAILCPELDSYVIEIEVPECDPICEFDLNVNYLECGAVDFYLPTSAVEVILDFGDGTETALGLYNHIYEESGTYLVCASYFDLVCEVWIEGCVTIQIETCNEFCDFEMEVLIGEECDFANFIFPDSANEIYLDLGDGNQINGVQLPYLTHVYEEGGWYTACASYYDFDCPDIPLTGCVEFYVIPCDENCEADLVWEEDECGEVSFYLGTQDLFEDFDMSFGDGNQGGTDSNVLYNLYEESGEYQVCYSYYSIECDLYFEDCQWIYVEGNCEDCSLEISVEVVDDVHIFSGYSSNLIAQYYWTVNDEYIQTADFLTYEIQEAGTYEICAHLENEYCPNGVEECMTIIVSEDEPECEGVTVSLEGFLDGNSSWLQVLECVLSSDGEDIWEGLISLSDSENSSELEFCLPEGCYEFSVTNGDPLILSSLLFLVEGLDLGDLEVEYDIDFLQGEASIYFDVGDGCDTGVSEIQSDVTIYPVPAADILNVDFGTPSWSYEVVDASGRHILTGMNSDTEEQIDVSVWSSGLYVLRAYNKEEMIIRKFKVQN